MEILDLFNEKVEMLDPSNYVDKVILNEISDEQCIIEDINTGIQINYLNCSVILSYGFSSLKLTVRHDLVFFGMPEEFIEITNYRRNRRKFDLNKGIECAVPILNSHRLTAEDKSFIISELKKAIEMAEMVTINNMTKPKMQNARKRLLNKE